MFERGVVTQVTITQQQPDITTNLAERKGCVSNMKQTGAEMMRAIPDLVLLTDVTEDAMYQALAKRLAEKRIYVSVSSAVWVCSVLGG